MCMDEKTCSKCKEVKPLDSFPPRKRSKDGRDGWCRPCHNISTKKSRERSPEALARSRQATIDRRERHRVWLREQKSKPCTDCGRRHPYPIMRFDHLPGTVKVVGINMGIAAKRETLEAEMAKCDLVCTMCHDYRTFYRTGSITDEEYATYRATWITSQR